MKKVMKNKKLIAMMVVGLVAIFLATSGVIASPPTGVGDPPVESKINYQGQLTDNNGNPLDGTYDMQFQFWDSDNYGSPVGSIITENDVAVTNGLFNVKLDVNQADFNGQGLWLEVKVEGQTLSPRQEILPVPYALSLKPGARISGTVDYNPVLHVSNDGSGITAVGLRATSMNAAGVYAESINAIGLSGVGHDNSIGTQGYNTGSGVGVKGYSQSGVAISACSASGAAISASGTGRIESTADSYIFISGNNFIKDCDYSSIKFTCNFGGSVSFWKGDRTHEYIFIPITVPGVLYGQEVTVEELTIYYKCEDGTQNYIDETCLYKQTDAVSKIIIQYDYSDKTSNSATSYTLTLTHNNVLSASHGILSLYLKLNFDNDDSAISIGGVRMRLGHS